MNGLTQILFRAEMFGRRGRGGRTSARFVIIVFLFAVFVISCVVPSAYAAPLDFGWGPPFNLKEQTIGDRTYLAWPIQISNSTTKRLASYLDIVAVTNTGRQYLPVSTVKVRGASSHSDLLSLVALQGQIFPSATRRGMAVFENMDPRARIIHFYVGGLVQMTPDDEENVTYLQITYERNSSGWEWKGMSVLK